MNQKVGIFLKQLFLENHLNKLPSLFGGNSIFSSPLIGVSSADDPIFQKFKKVVSPEHLTPVEMWTQSGLPKPSQSQRRLKVLSIIFPFENTIREEAKIPKGASPDAPPDIYSVGRNYANAFMLEVLKQTTEFFQENGYSAMAGMTSQKFKIIAEEEEQKVHSTWSERHVAFAAGLGTFSLHEGFISEAGCNVRMTSVITDAPLKTTPRKNDDPYGNCLFYQTGKCKKCISRCPAGAISESGHDKLKCYIYGQKLQDDVVKRHKDLLKPHYRRINGSDNWSYPVGCALCQFSVPCSTKNPVSTRN